MAAAAMAAAVSRADSVATLHAPPASSRGAGETSRGFLGGRARSLAAGGGIGDAFARARGGPFARGAAGPVFTFSCELLMRGRGRSPAFPCPSCLLVVKPLPVYQVRTCPSPSITHWNVVRPCRPIVPRQCSLLVAVPISAPSPSSPPSCSRVLALTTTQAASTS